MEAETKDLLHDNPTYCNVWLRMLAGKKERWKRTRWCLGIKDLNRISNKSITKAKGIAAVKDKLRKKRYAALYTSLEGTNV